MTNIEQAKDKYKCYSLFDLYVAKERDKDSMNSEDKQAVVAWIEVKKDNRDRWTLFFAALAAIGTIIGLFLKSECFGLLDIYALVLMSPFHATTLVLNRV